MCSDIALANGASIKFISLCFQRIAEKSNPSARIFSESRRNLDSRSALAGEKASIPTLPEKFT